MLCTVIAWYVPKFQMRIEMVMPTSASTAGGTSASATDPPAPPARQSSTFAADLSLIQTLDASSDDDDEATVEGE